MLSVLARRPPTTPGEGTVTHSGSGVAPLPWRCLPNRGPPPCPELCPGDVGATREKPLLPQGCQKARAQAFGSRRLDPALDSEEQAFHPLLLASSLHPRLAPRPAPQSLVLLPTCPGSSHKAWAAPPWNAHARSWPSLCASEWPCTCARDGGRRWSMSSSVCPSRLLVAAGRAAVPRLPALRAPLSAARRPVLERGGCPRCHPLGGHGA